MDYNCSFSKRTIECPISFSIKTRVFFIYHVEKLLPSLSGNSLYITKYNYSFEVFVAPNYILWLDEYCLLPGCQMFLSLTIKSRLIKIEKKVKRKPTFIFSWWRIAVKRLQNRSIMSYTYNITLIYFEQPMYSGGHFIILFHCFNCRLRRNVSRKAHDVHQSYLLTYLSHDNSILHVDCLDSPFWLMYIVFFIHIVQQY